MSNEITVKISCSLEEMYNDLENKGFEIVDKYYLEDIYYIPKEIDIRKQPIRKILSKYVLIRNITQFVPDKFIDNYNLFTITYKSKNISEDGTIIEQNKKDCIIEDIEQGKEIIKALEYKDIMTIREKTIVYCKNELKLAIKNVENGDNLIEIETIEDNPELDTTDKLKEKINELHIDIDTKDYFVQKVEIELNRILLGE